MLSAIQRSKYLLPHPCHLQEWSRQARGKQHSQWHREGYQGKDDKRSLKMSLYMQRRMQGQMRK